jgi:hypothetical protein
MARLPFSFVLSILMGASLSPAAISAAPSPAPSASSTPVANVVSHDAGTIDGIVSAVDYTPGKSSMTVKSGAQSYVFAVLAGTNVEGPSRDFAVDVKLGTHVAVSASKSGTTYTAQIVRVLPLPAHAGR